MSIAATNPQPATPAKPPVLRIAPVAHWWALPFGELWDYRELLYFFIWRDIKVRYKQTAIGAAWAVLQPFLTMLIFSLFFGKLAHIPSQGLPYPIFYYSALLPWMYFAAALQNATNTIVENQRLITKVYFPRLDLPLSSVLSGLVDFGISFLMFVAMMVYYGIRPTPALLWLPAFLLFAVLTALGVGLWLAALNAMYRDVRYVLPFLVQFWMFASPVAYPASLGEAPGRLVFISAVAVLAVLLGGIAYFQKMETVIADVV
jgi:lipopolysaccharide transport system permease protein